MRVVDDHISELWKLIERAYNDVFFREWNPFGASRRCYNWLSAGHVVHDFQSCASTHTERSEPDVCGVYIRKVIRILRNLNYPRISTLKVFLRKLSWHYDKPRSRVLPPNRLREVVLDVIDC